jgi:hypothetical protein
VRYAPLTTESAAIFRQSRPILPPHHPTEAQNRRIYGYGATLSANFPSVRIFAASPRLKKTPVAPLSG